MKWSAIFATTAVTCLYLALQVKGQRPIFPELANPRIVIVGPTGSGKSSLANALLGCDPSLDDCMFEVCDGMNSCTKNTTYGTGPWLGKGQNFTVVDTPGFSDTNNEDDALVEEMMDILANKVEHADTILLLLKGTITRFNKGLQEMIKRMTLMFGHDWWDFVLVGVSFWPYDQYNIDHRKCDPHYPDKCKDEKWYAREINGQMHEKFGTEKNFTFVFTDSWSQVAGPPGYNSQDLLQQKHWHIETGNLWNITNGRDQNFAFMTINDFMEENARQKAEIKWLNDVIMNNITALAAQIGDNTEKIADNCEADKNLEEVVNHAIENIVDNTEKIAGNSEADNSLKEVVNHVIENVGDVTTKAVMNEIHIKDITEETLPDLLPPVGSIIAWIPSPNKEGEHSAVPNGWQRCDGSTITKGIYKNLKTPNLNGEGRFLRGGNDAKVRTLEEDTFQDHTHTLTDHGHKHDDNGHTHTDGGHSHGIEGYRFESLPQWGFNFNWDISTDNSFLPVSGPSSESKAQIQSSKANIASASTGITVGTTQDGYSHGAETRPKNMNVIYIMRIF